MAAQTNKCVHEHTTQLGYCYELICFLPRNSCLLIPEVVVELRLRIRGGDRISASQASAGFPLDKCKTLILKLVTEI